MTLVAGLFALLVVVTLIWILTDVRGSDLRLHPEPDRDRDHGRVSVVVPMRDEVGNVDRCLAALRSQSYSNLEVIVVDDGSTDGTADRLTAWQEQWPDLEVVTLDGPPPGWAGKAHALHRGVQQARGEWLLFIDADVELGPTATARVLATAHARGWPVLSVIGRLRLESYWERVLLLYYSVVLHLSLIEFPDFFLVGHCTLLRRSTYDEIGGYAAIPTAVSTDLQLAGLVFGHGIRPRLRVWPEAYRCRMYTSGAAVRGGLSRMMAASTGFRAVPLVLLALLLVATTILPQLVVVWSLVAPVQGGQVSLPLVVSTSCLVAIQWVAFGLTVRRVPAPGWLALGKPIGDLGMFLLTLGTAWRVRRGRVTWKGRTYERGEVDGSGGPRVRTETGEDRHLLSIVVTCGPPTGAADPAGTPRCAVEAFRRTAETVHGVETIVVQDAAATALPGGAIDLEAVTVADGSYWELKRRGLEAARAPVVAFAEAHLDYPPDWAERIIAAFEDLSASLVTAPTKVTSRSARAEALAIREWGHLTGSSVRYPNPGNFAGRRELLLRTLPGRHVDHRGGEVILGMLASIQGSSFQVLPELTASASDAAPDVPAIDLLLSRLSVATSLTRTATAWLGERSIALLLIRRLIPAMVWADNSLLRIRALPRSRGRLATPGGGRLAVALWGEAYSLLDLGLALRGVVQPEWLLRRGGIGVRPHDEDQEHPGLRLPAARIAGIVRRMLVSPRLNLPAAKPECGAG
jgi:hypothetical protein